MIKSRAVILYSLLFVVLFFSSGRTGWGEGPQDPMGDNARIDNVESAEGRIVPGPENVKQKTALCVFIGWLWLCIAVSIFFLRMKIKEADRLLSLEYFSEDSQ